MIQRWFLAHLDEWDIWVLAELRVQVGPTRFRVPDVTVIARGLPREEIITHPPVAVFEVLSPEDRVPRMLVKLQDYARMGIQNIFMIDPRDGSIWHYLDGHLLPAESGPMAGSPGRIDWEQIRKFVV